MPVFPSWIIQNLTKTHRRKPALTGVSLEIRPGEVHAVLGEDGAGKSTLARVLSGAETPDGGEILLGGAPRVFRNPIEARRAGAVAVYQESGLAPTLSVAENIFLGGLDAQSGGLLDWGKMRAAAGKALQALGLEIAPTAIVADLRPVDQVLVEIARAVSFDPSLLILEQSASFFGKVESEFLMGLTRRLKDQGRAVLYLTDQPEEALRIADRVTILREGRVVATSPVAEIDAGRAATLMAGFDVEREYPKELHAAPDLCLEVRDLSTGEGLKEVSFDVRRGEVFGLTGPGSAAIGRALAGLERISGGEVKLNGEKARYKNAAEAFRAGIGVALKERQEDGSLLRFETPPGFSFSGLVEFLQAPFLDMDKFGGFSMRAGQDFSPDAVRRSLRYLAGGSRQRKRIQHWLTSQARLLIMDDPACGLDAGGRLAVYRVINELAAAGISVLLIGSNHRELLGMCARVGVVKEGRIAKVVSKENATVEDLAA